MNKGVIAVCIVRMDENVQTDSIKAITQRAEEQGLYVEIYNSFVELHKHDLHDKGEESVYDIIDYKHLSGIILFPEKIKSEAINEKIIRNAKAFPAKELSNGLKPRLVPLGQHGADIRKGKLLAQKLRAFPVVHRDRHRSGEKRPHHGDDIMIAVFGKDRHVGKLFPAELRAQEECAAADIGAILKKTFRDDVSGRIVYPAKRRFISIFPLHVSEVLTD